MCCIGIATALLKLHEAKVIYLKIRVLTLRNRASPIGKSKTAESGGVVRQSISLQWGVVKLG